MSQLKMRRRICCYLAGAGQDDSAREETLPPAFNGREGHADYKYEKRPQIFKKDGLHHAKHTRRRHHQRPPKGHRVHNARPRRPKPATAQPADNAAPTCFLYFTNAPRASHTLDPAASSVKQAPDKERMKQFFLFQLSPPRRQCVCRR